MANALNTFAVEWSLGTAGDLNWCPSNPHTVHNDSVAIVLLIDSQNFVAQPCNCLVRISVL